MMKHKKYIVFAFFDYYPSGGLGDIKESFDDLEEARKFTTPTYDDYMGDVLYDNYEIVDRDTWEIVV